MVKWDRSKGRPEPIAALNRIPLKENGDPLVDLREFAPSLRIYRPQTIPYARLEVAEMAQRATESLPKGMFLAVVDAWRPFARQRRIYEFMLRCAQEAFPHRTHASLRRTVCRWVAPIDQKSPPGHCTGAALDVWLVDEAGEVIDVTSPYDRFHAAPTYALGLSEEARRNREILIEAMLGAGFSNCRDEWWHYSYGDAGWAVRLDRPSCFYGLIELDPALYAEQERLSEEAFKTQQNPFLPPT